MIPKSDITGVVCCDHCGWLEQIESALLRTLADECPRCHQGGTTIEEDSEKISRLRLTWCQACQSWHSA